MIHYFWLTQLVRTYNLNACISIDVVIDPFKGINKYLKIIEKMILDKTMIVQTSYNIATKIKD